MKKSIRNIIGVFSTTVLLSSCMDLDETVYDKLPTDSFGTTEEQLDAYLFNIGSVGQPRNHDPRASFCIYDDIDRTVTRYRVPYDIAGAQAKIRAAGLPERLAVRLESGS